MAQQGQIVVTVLAEADTGIDQESRSFNAVLRAEGDAPGQIGVDLQ